jgi:hypothetical protein
MVSFAVIHKKLYVNVSKSAVTRHNSRNKERAVIKQAKK